MLTVSPTLWTVLTLQAENRATAFNQTSFKNQAQICSTLGLLFFHILLKIRFVTAPPPLQKYRIGHEVIRVSQVSTFSLYHENLTMMCPFVVFVLTLKLNPEFHRMKSFITRHSQNPMISTGLDHIGVTPNPH